MNPYITQLKKELAEYEKACGGEAHGSILELLWYCYSTANAVDDGRIGAAERALVPVFEELSVEASNTLDDYISDLCYAYQRAAFLEGIQVGASLTKELEAM